jgi:glucose-1-phosphate cytidylyltransferase
VPDVPVLILCGGRGTRLQQHSTEIPKPLVEIGGRPILWHVISIYARQGHREFVLCTGYKRELIEAFVAATEWPPAVRVTCVDTGGATPTGGRLHLAREHVGGRTSCVTYADGVADVDLAAQAAFHAAHGALATITVVRPELPFGVVELDGGSSVTAFREKPRAEHWVNGGFFVFEPAVLDRLDPDSVLERGPLEELAADGALHAYRHEGFWACLDTYKDAVRLNDVWDTGAAPWLPS